MQKGRSQKKREGRRKTTVRDYEVSLTHVMHTPFPPLKGNPPGQIDPFSHPWPRGRRCWGMIRTPAHFLQKQPACKSQPNQRQENMLDIGLNTMDGRLKRIRIFSANSNTQIHAGDAKKTHRVFHGWVEMNNNCRSSQSTVLMCLIVVNTDVQ